MINSRTTERVKGHTWPLPEHGKERCPYRGTTEAIQIGDRALLRLAMVDEILEVIVLA